MTWRWVRSQRQQVRSQIEDGAVFVQEIHLENNVSYTVLVKDKLRRAALTVNVDSRSAPSGWRYQVASGRSYLRTIPWCPHFLKAVRELPTQD